MPETPKEIDPLTPEEILNSIHADLKSGKVQTRLSAIQKTIEQKFSSLAILHTLEQLALNDKSKFVREAARQALTSPTHRYIRSRVAELKQKERKTILAEIADWESQGIIQREQADVLRRRYDFDLKSAAAPQLVTSAPQSGPEPAPLEKTPPTPKAIEPLPPKQPAAPRPSLTQTLLSETSIKIALYLGAFFVISAAIILAAVVEAARLPILLTATVLFAGGAVVTRIRLPQPSFALFMVFSFLLPTDANVLADVLSLSSKANAGYWFAVMAVMALIWAFGTWFYVSRLFSLAAFIALVISIVRLGEFIEAEPEIYLILVSFVTLLGLGGVFLLKRWRSAKLSLPLFILVQISQLGLIAFAIIAVAIRLEDFPSAWNLMSTTFWVLTMGFYLLSDLIFPFFLFPWLSIAALYPVPLNFMLTFDVEALPIVIATWVWGLLLAGTSELSRRLQTDKIHRYGLPALTGSVLVILTAVFIGYVEDIVFGFAFILASAFLYTLLHILKPRVYVWVTSLLLGLGAYFSFFALPGVEKLDIFACYQFLGASLLLLLPDLFLTPDFSVNKTWRWPLRILGAFLAFLNLSLILPTSTEIPGHTAITYGVYAVFFVPYALRYKRAWLGYLATASAALSLTLALQHFDLDAWMPALTGLAGIYYLGGWALKRRADKWSGMMRISGLVVSALVALIALFIGKEFSGWYILITGVFFTVEMFVRQNGWLEAGPGFFFPSALIMLLIDFDVDPAGYYMLGLSLLWLTLDLVFERTFRGKRPLTWPMRILGALLTGSNTLYLISLNPDGSRVALACFGSYTIFFLVYALLRRKPLLGYAFAAFLPISIWYLLRELQQDNWLLPMMAPALVYYLVGFVLSRREGAAGWANMLRYSGLGLASLVTISAIFTSEEGGGWYAIMTALLFTIEMFSNHTPLAEAGIQLFLATGVFTLVREAEIYQSYQWLAIALVLLGTDLVLARTYKEKRLLAWFSRGFGAFIILIHSLDLLFITTDSRVSAICLGIYTLFFLTQAVLYRQPILGYGFTSYSLMAIIFTLQTFDQPKWLLPITALATIYYGSGFYLRKRKPEYVKPGRGQFNATWQSFRWPFVLWTSGLGAVLLATIVAPLQGGLSAAIPPAVIATMIAIEAFDRRNIWLGFPANGFYLMAYFILLIELNVDEPQFFSIATAALGILMHYLLTRAGSRTGAFITGMVSQLVLLGTTYIQFLSTERLLFFAVIFFQALAVLAYGIVIRSRSLVITPIIFLVLSVITVLYGLLEGILPVILIGCTGLILLLLGILAVVMRDRFKQISERFIDWTA